MEGKVKYNDVTILNTIPRIHVFNRTVMLIDSKAVMKIDASKHNSKVDYHTAERCYKHSAGKTNY